MIYESSVKTTVYKISCKNGGVCKEISDDSYGFNIDEPCLERYNTPDEAIDNFLTDYKGWTFECRDWENGCKCLVATSPIMTSQWSCRCLASVLIGLTGEQLKEFKSENTPVYQVEAVLKVSELTVNPYNVEDYLNKFKG